MSAAGLAVRRLALERGSDASASASAPTPFGPVLPVGFASIRIDGTPVAIEYRWANPDVAIDDAPIVLLHEGLGSVGAWRDFPDRLAATTGRRVLAYSRPGYGRSTPRAPDERWAPDFMHRQAETVLPALLDALRIDGRVVLVGHSDGGSIALLAAAVHPARVERVVVLAPHLFVEPLTIAGIEAARRAYLEGDLRERLARHHDDPDSAFLGWNDVWLDPAFRNWNIEREVGRVEAPILAIQGVDDAYGTLEQIRTIARLRPGTRLVELDACGHAPHRDRTDDVLGAVRTFLQTPFRPLDPPTGDPR